MHIWISLGVIFAVLGLAIGLSLLVTGRREQQSIGHSTTGGA
jgi:Ca2+/H+ antiporter